MAEEKFSDNLMRMLAAELHFLNVQTASREMLGKSYYALGVAEKNAVEQMVLGAVSGNYQAITPQFLANQEARQAVGFPTQASQPTSGNP